MFNERKDRHKLIDIDLRQKQVNEGTVPSSECDGTMKHTTKLPLPQLIFFVFIDIKKIHNIPMQTNFVENNVSLL